MSPIETLASDKASIFTYDGEFDPDSFSLVALQDALSAHFGERCEVQKLAEGGYHKVYDVVRPSRADIEAVVRVAAPAFPVDKLESEVATMMYLKEKSRIPVPKILTWNSDPSNPVGAEYMVMEKVPGVSASEVWEDLPKEMQSVTVSDIARYILEMSSHRFAAGGSLYRSPETGVYTVGPIIATPYYRALDGEVRVTGTPRDERNLNPNRGPYSSTTEYLQATLKAELDFISAHRAIALSWTEGDASRLELGIRAMTKALELCSLYPGDRPIPEGLSAPHTPFSFRLDDLRLSNIMIDKDTGRVNGLIDFEGTTLSPLWTCATIPRWLQHPDDPESSYEGGPPELRAELRKVFIDSLGDGEGKVEWMKAYEDGRPYRRLTDRLSFLLGVWASDATEQWVDERLAWAKEHPGMPFPEDVE